MIEEVNAYFEYLSKFQHLDRPQMPRFNHQVFVGKEYLDIALEMEPIDDFVESVEEEIDYLKEN